GRIVCAEVHANGADVENPDPHAMDLINQAAIAQIRNPAMGIELRRRLVDAGLESVRGAAVAFAETSIDPDETDDSRRQPSELADRGELEPARAQSAIDYVVAAN